VRLNYGKQEYVKTVYHNNNKSGNDSKTCSYFNELNEIFACNPLVEPVAECSNGKGYIKQKIMEGKTQTTGS
jgi:hypothetical protein